MHVPNNSMQEQEEQYTRASDSVGDRQFVVCRLYPIYQGYTAYLDLEFVVEEC